MSEFRIGISGWRYAPWRNNFYPKGLIQRKELFFASRSVNSIEINGSFYALQTPDRYCNWYSETPANFIFSVKAPRYITHIKRLNDVEEPIANFFASGVLMLQEKLGPILWQFPPSFKFDKELFTQFLELLPKNIKTAVTLTKKFHHNFSTPKEIAPNQRIRHSVEIRNTSFVTEDFIELLRHFNVAFVVADSAGRFPFGEDITSDFIYMRLHGDKELYRSGYSDAAIHHWFTRIKSWSQGVQPRDAKLIGKRAKHPQLLDVYCYFDNTDKLWAPKDARHLLRLLGQDAQLMDEAELLELSTS
ncbi:MAG TPA: DUF72 domain-containing protein [Cellvibrio sp.]|nr:DUF72 domain-containing protein [Cellvibrio sp.]